MREKNELQGTGQWHSERTGKLTASRMNDAMSFLKGKAGKAPEESSKRYELKKEILLERLTNNIVSKYVNDAMQHGIETEPLAKETFEQKTGILIQDVGFVNHPVIDNFGCSPDGYTSDGGLIEVKCPTEKTMLEYILKDEIPENHKKQMCVQALCTKRDFIHFVAFDNRLPEDMQLFHKIYTPTKEELKEVELAAIQFLDEVDEMFFKLTHR